MNNESNCWLLNICKAARLKFQQHEWGRFNAAGNTTEIYGSSRISVEVAEFRYVPIFGISALCAGQAGSPCRQTATAALPKSALRNSPCAARRGFKVSVTNP